ncbi:unnamed protein product [Closterium sp. Yama58-4]|nr:unnamed protein product [Closterium sp. Yama58-4]
MHGSKTPGTNNSLVNTNSPSRRHRNVTNRTPMSGRGQTTSEARGQAGGRDSPSSRGQERTNQTGGADSGTPPDRGFVPAIERGVECRFCKREFQDPRALGGHMNLHRREIDFERFMDSQQELEQRWQQRAQAEDQAVAERQRQSLADQAVAERQRQSLADQAAAERQRQTLADQAVAERQIELSAGQQTQRAAERLLAQAAASALVRAQTNSQMQGAAGTEGVAWTAGQEGVGQQGGEQQGAGSGVLAERLLGGAELLIVVAAAELASRGHSVRVFTAHHDPHRCFPETIDGTFPVHVHGSFLPRHIAGRFHAVCAYLRCLWAALFIVISVWLRWIPAVDAIITDQVSAVHPILRLLPAKILFYCHFPDLLLAQRGSWLRSLYRAPIDWVEQVTTGMADTIVVNSHFTAATFAATFPSLASHGIRPAVLYPAVALDSPSASSSATASTAGGDISAAPSPAVDEAEKLGADLNCPFFLSINRYERKKEIATAISALGLLTRLSAHTGTAHGQETGSQDATAALAKGQRPRLVVAGGCDARVKENVEYLQELKQLAAMEGLASDVLFLTSISDSLKAQLLSHCTAVVYTPPN